MHYKLYSTEDFIQDEFFQQWVFSQNDETNHYWSTFLLHYPMQRKKIEDAREFLLAMNFKRVVPETVVQRIKHNFNAAVDAFESGQNRIEQASKLPAEPTRKSTFFRIAFPIAASLLFVGFLIGYVLLQNEIPMDVFQKLTLEEQKTPQGKKRHIILIDGTHIWLNADSEIKYPRNFSGKNIREVYLEGEAFFDVAENKEKPFIVHTSDLAIKVLGTAFNVRSYSKDPVVETTLVHGKVSIASVSEDAVILLPNQQALFTKDSRILALEDTVDTGNYIAWKNGWMIFDNKPFSFIKETMERWYDVSIIMEDENSLSCTYSAKFKDKTLLEVLEIFKNTEAINYRIEGNQVFINGKLCQYTNPD